MNNRRNALYFTALVVALAFVWFTGPARPTWAQGPGLTPLAAPEVNVPGRLTYQGRITDPATGNPISGTFTIVFRIYDDLAAGAKLWEESKDVPVSAGLFSTVLGDTALMDPAMFNGQSLWLAVKVQSDAEATPRQQILPVAYAMSLAPGATIATTSGAPALTVNNAGAGDALRVQGAGYAGNFTSSGGTGLRGDTGSTANESAGLLGVAGWTSTALNNYAGVFGKSANGYGVGGISDNNVGVYGQSSVNYGVYGLSGGSPAAVYGTNTGSGVGVQGVSATSYGVRGIGGSGAGDFGGYFTGQSGVYGQGIGFAGQFTSTASHGVFGDSGATSTGYAGVFGRSLTGAVGVYGWTNTSAPGVQAYSATGWGTWTSGGAGALYANGNATVNGTLTTQRLAYSTPRTHYWSVGGEGFQPTSSGAIYNNYGGMGGACVSTGSNLVAPVHLPHGATVTSLTGKYYVNGGPVVSVYLYRLTLTGGYASLASVSSSGLSGYGSASTSSIGWSVIDNTNYGYFINAWWGTGNCNTEVMGAVVAYTLSEAE